MGRDVNAVHQVERLLQNLQGRDLTEERKRVRRTPIPGGAANPRR